AQTSLPVGSQEAFDQARVFRALHPVSRLAMGLVEGREDSDERVDCLPGCFLLWLLFPKKLLILIPIPGRIAEGFEEPFGEGFEEGFAEGFEEGSNLRRCLASNGTGRNFIEGSAPTFYNVGVRWDVLLEPRRNPQDTRNRVVAPGKGTTHSVESPPERVGA